MATSLPLEETLGYVGSVGGVGENFEEVVFRGVGFRILGMGAMILNLFDKGCLSSSSESSSTDIVPFIFLFSEV
ncbi:hypothetical protein Tco_0422626 [Tanacetum coccineum]